MSSRPNLTITTYVEARSGLELRVLLFRRQGDDQWVAQVLEKDMTAHGETEYAALAAVHLVLQTHVNFDARQQRVPLSRLRPAPEMYFRAYEHAEPLDVPAESDLRPAHIRPAITHESISLH